MKVIEQYLVSLGFKIDQGSFTQFTNGIKKGAISVGALIGVVEGLTIALTAMTISLAQGQRELAILSQNAGTSVKNIERFQYVASLSGSSAEAATKSIQGLSDAMASIGTGNEHAASILQSLGISVFGQGGKLRDTTQVMIELGRALSGFDRRFGQNILQQLGIDPTTLDAITAQVGDLGKEFDTVFKNAGVDAKSVAENSTKLVNQWTRFKFLTHTLGLSIIDKLAKSIELTFKNINDNFSSNIGTIANVLSTIAEVLIYAFDSINSVIKKSIDFFNDLSTSGKIFVGVLAAVVAGWGAYDTAIGIAIGLTRAFSVAATAAWEAITGPVGLVIMALITIGAIFEDLITYIRGGQSLYDGFWSGFIKDAKIVWGWLEKIWNIWDKIVGDHTFNLSSQATGAISAGAPGGRFNQGGGVVSHVDNSNVTINVNGAGDPGEVARHVADLQNDRSSRIRHMGTSFR